MGAFAAAVEEDISACKQAASAAPPNPQQQQQQRQQQQQQRQQQQRGSAGGRTSARLAGVVGGGATHADRLTDTFGAFDACVEAARVEPAVFAFAAWRQQQKQQQQKQQQQRWLQPGQWVEVLAARTEDKRFFYSSIGVVQQVRLTLPLGLVCLGTFCFVLRFCCFACFAFACFFPYPSTAINGAVSVAALFVDSVYFFSSCFALIFIILFIAAARLLLVVSLRSF